MEDTCGQTRICLACSKDLGKMPVIPENAIIRSGMKNVVIIFIIKFLAERWHGFSVFY